MIRQPTSKAAQYAWYRAAIAGREPPRHDGMPEAGFYKTRLVKGGPFVPIRIWLDQEICPVTGELMADESLRCEALGQSRNPETIWTYLRPIPRAEYDALVDLHRSMDLMAAVNAPINIEDVRHAAPTPQWRI
ncbi:hypothetical protein [Yoonia sp.]|uniref:hypothetical protein n=1 Tax=Yoonia sp. TaxID=2212373 RepID=UPI002E0B6BCF|nr:hypothetical protein [Yoonia sp.]